MLHLLYQLDVREIQHNINRLKKGKGEELKQALVREIEIAEHKGEVKGLKGFVVMDSAADEQESISS
jgi:hypothetical protein